jgi:cysteine desulfurase
MPAAVYLDNAASTRVDADVVRVMQACLVEDYGNPSSAHAAGLAADKRLKQARAELGAAIGDARNTLGDLLFTSGGTEADALAVLGAARARRGRGKHLVVTAFEHSAVLSAAKLLEGEGFTTTLVAPGRDGVVTAEAVAAAVRDDTVLVACMLVQNELGTVQPVAAIARAARAKRAELHVHCDAVQALGKIPVDVAALGVDSLAVSAHKLHGPKGAGALWLEKGARLQPLWGGPQQQGLRAGTENVPGAAGLGAAARLAVARLGETAAIGARRDRLVAGALAAVPGAYQNGAGAPRVPHIASIVFPALPAEPLLHALEARGVYVSAGSACSAKAKKSSATLEAIGAPKDAATLRFSLCRDTTDADVDASLSALVAAIADVRPVTATSR